MPFLPMAGCAAAAGDAWQGHQPQALETLDKPRLVLTQPVLGRDPEGLGELRRAAQQLVEPIETGRTAGAQPPRRVALQKRQPQTGQPRLKRLIMRIARMELAWGHAASGPDAALPPATAARHDSTT